MDEKPAVTRRKKYLDVEVAASGKERRHQLQQIYEKNTCRILDLIYHHPSFINPSWKICWGVSSVWWSLVFSGFFFWYQAKHVSCLLFCCFWNWATSSQLGKPKKKIQKKTPQSVGVQACGSGADLVDAATQTDPWEPRLEDQSHILSLSAWVLLQCTVYHIPVWLVVSSKFHWVIVI